MGRVSLQLGDLHVEGRSRAGMGSFFRVRPPGLVFDAGRGAPQLAGAKDIFLTHGHLDHALGVPFVLSQRSLHQSAETRVFCPAQIVDALRALVRAAEKLERSVYRFQLIGLEAGQRVEVGRGMTVEAFAVDHVVPALGYHLIHRKARLRGDLEGATAEELVELRRRGDSVEEYREEVSLSYPGDTAATVLDCEPRLYESRVLLLECTFLGEESRGRAQRYKHIHLEDLVARQSLFRNEVLLLHHLSRRHSVDDLRRQVEERMPDLASKVHYPEESHG